MEFHAAVSRMEPGKVQVSPYFDMLEGTRALEIGNKSLDTGIIEFLPSEINFDCSQGRTLPEVVAVMSCLLRQFMAWINGLSLLVTVLSNRYMYDLLSNFKRNFKVEEADFVNRRLHGVNYTPEDSEESRYVNIVLRGYVIGLAKTISIFLKVALDVLYEEEDLVTRSMDLSYFCTTPFEGVLLPVKAATNYLESMADVPFKNVALSHLQLVKHLLKISTSLHDSVQLFKRNLVVNLGYLQESIKILQGLKLQEYVDIPELLISRFVQADCNNRHILSDNDTLDAEEAIEKLIGILQAINRILITFSTLRNDSQLLIYLKNEVGMEMAYHESSVVRGFFQIFFIRDNKSIAGLKETVRTLGLRCMESLCLVSNSIMMVDQWNIEGTSDVEGVRDECIAKMSHLLEEFDSAFYQKLCVYGNNRCRQRQLLSRNLVLWDALQCNSENVEVDLFKYGIGDKFSRDGSADQPMLAISSYVYHVKLSMMVEVVLTGFEQDIYSLSEAHMMYWYAGELYAHAHQHISGRLKEINVSKLTYTQNMPKRIKKAKGEKKESLQLKYQHLVAESVPILETNIALIESHLEPISITHYYLCRALSKAIQLFSGISEPPKGNMPLADAEKLFRLRLKPWSSIGSIELPTHARYRESNNIFETLANSKEQERIGALKKIARNVQHELEMVKRSCRSVMENFANNEKLKDRLRFCGDKYMNEWNDSIVKTCDLYLQQIRSISTFTGEDKYRLQRKPGVHVFYPIYHLSKEVEVKA